MKNLKIALLSFAIILACFTSCTNNEPVVQPQQTEESESITTALTELATSFGQDGNVIPPTFANNPTGNIVFDFCFNFVYPIDLSFNNDTTVTVNSFEELIEVLITSNDQLFVNGIAFPFDVETFDEDSDAIVIVTINNEDEFIDLIEDCDFDGPDCQCTEEFDPVCVTVQDPNGVSFTITFPNECWAECEGFTEDDFMEDCDDDFDWFDDEECFEFNFPLTIITDDGQSVTVNSEEELDTALFDTFFFEFEFPITVTTADGNVLTINGEDDFEDLLDECFDDINDPGDCDCEDIIDPVCVEYEEGGVTFTEVFPNECIALCAGFTPNNFVECDGNTGDCDGCTDEFDPVCVLVDTPVGPQVFTFPNACWAECEGFTENDFVDCEDNNQNDCTEEDYINNLLECPWVLVPSNSNTPYQLTFNEDGTFNIVDLDETISLNGSWSIEADPSGNYTLTLTEPAGDFNSTWLLFDCNDEFLVSAEQSWFATKDCD